MSFGSTPAIKPKSRSRCRSGMPPRIACVAIEQSFAERGVTPAHRHRAYKCAALRAASRVSGAMTIGNSPSTRSQRVNRSGLYAPCRTSCRMGGASQTGAPCSRASVSSSTSIRLSPRLRRFARQCNGEGAFDDGHQRHTRYRAGSNGLTPCRFLKTGLPCAPQPIRLGCPDGCEYGPSGRHELPGRQCRGPMRGPRTAAIPRSRH